MARRIGHAVDQTGAYFIDRDGALFAIILQWLRSFDRPSQRILYKHGDALLEECNYYGETTLPQVLRGELAPTFFLRPADRAILRQEEEAALDLKTYAQELLIDVHAVDTAPRDRKELEQPLLLNKAPRVPLMGDLRAFHNRLNKSSCGLLDAVAGIPGLVFAGGAVLAALTGGHSNDIDIFLTCDPADGEVKLREIYAAVQSIHAKTGKKARFMATRSKCAVSFYLSSVPADTPPIQVITCTHTSTLDVLSNFDVDCCCFAYAPSEGGRVVCTPRGLRALRYNVNFMDGRFASGSYCQRLEKYSQRGFAVAIPGYLPARVSNDILKGTYAEYPDHDVLFKLGPKNHSVETVQITHVNHSLIGSGASTERVSIAAKQTARAVQDIERLIARDRCQPLKLEAPAVNFCEKHQRPYVDDTKIDVFSTPVSTGIPHEYFLLWGMSSLPTDKDAASASDPSEDEESEDDTHETFYERTPLLRIYTMMRKHTDQLLDSYNGGALSKLLSRRIAAGSVRTAHEHIVGRIAKSIKTRSPLHLVYDIVPQGATFELGLAWVRDSRRSPLLVGLTDAEYEKEYGLPPRLTFSRRQRRVPIANDFWHGIY